MTEGVAWLDPVRPPRVLAEIHGTVDLERALAEHGLDATAAADAVDDPLLGARVVVAGDGPVRVAIAEPSTEGRLAGALARQGEGTVGRYVLAPVPLDEVRGLAAAAGVALTRTESGPFGDALLVVGARIGDHQLILVDPARVPSAR